MKLQTITKHRHLGDTYGGTSIPWGEDVFFAHIGERIAIEGVRVAGTRVHMEVWISPTTAVVVTGPNTNKGDELAPTAVAAMFSESYLVPRLDED